MENIKNNIIRNNMLLYIFTAVVVSVILFFLVNISRAEQNDKKPLNLWENNSLIVEEEKNTEELDSSNLILNNEIITSNNKIDESDIAVSSLDGIGIYDESNGGFPVGIWKNSNIDQIEYLLNELPADLRNTFLRNLINKSLLTISNPPIQKNGNSKKFFDIKIKYLEDSANYGDIEKLFYLISEDDLDDDIIKKFVTSRLLKNDYKTVCKLVEKISDEKFELEINSFCKAMSNNLPALDLMISLLVEEDITDKDLISIYYSYINKTEIDLENINKLDIKKINLVSNLGIDYSDYIDENSSLEMQLFFIYSKLKTDDKKITLAENLLASGALQGEILGNLYKQIFLNSNKNTSIDYLSLESSLKKRVGIYNMIRNTSDQSRLPKLLGIYVDEMGSQELLMNTASLVYDKAKIIVPKQSYKNDILPVCIILLINNDYNRCEEWLEAIKFDNQSKEIIKKLEFYLYLKSDNQSLKSNILNDTEYYLNLDGLSDLDKSIIAKYLTYRQENQFLDFWRSKNDMKRTSGITINIKLIEYLKQIKDISIGESILLLSLVYGNNHEHSKDAYALFSIIHTLEAINPGYTDDFLFEYFTNNLL